MLASGTARRAGPVQAITLLLQCTLGVMGTAILAPVIPRMIDHFRDIPGVAFWAPLVVTVPSLCIVICAPIAGYLGDLFGRRLLLIGAIGTYAITGVLPYFLEKLALILLSRVALGVVEAMVMTLSTTMIGDYFHGVERDKWLGYQTAVASVSAVAMLALGGWLGDYGWHAPFLIYLIALPLMLLVVCFTWEPSSSEREQVAGTATWFGFPWRRMAGVSAVTLLAAMLFYIVQIQLSSALAERGIIRPSEAGLYTSIVSIGIPVGTVIFQRISAWRIGKLLTLEFGLVGIAFVGMSQVTSVPLFLTIAAANQVGCGLLLPTMLTWAVKQLAFAHRGRGIGIWQSVLSFGPPLGPALVTAIAIWTRSGINGAFAFVGGASIFAALIAGASLFHRGGNRDCRAESGA